VTDSCPTWSTRLAWLENDLPDEEAQLLNTHVGDCDECREKFGAHERRSGFLGPSGVAGTDNHLSAPIYELRSGPITFGRSTGASASTASAACGTATEVAEPYQSWLLGSIRCLQHFQRNIELDGEVEGLAVRLGSKHFPKSRVRFDFPLGVGKADLTASARCHILVYTDQHPPMAHVERSAQQFKPHDFPAADLQRCLNTDLVVNIDSRVHALVGCFLARPRVLKTEFSARGYISAWMGSSLGTFHRARRSARPRLFSVRMITSSSWSLRIAVRHRRLCRPRYICTSWPHRDGFLRPCPPSPVSLVRGCAPHITVVLTWFEELKQRVPTGR